MQNTKLLNKKEIKLIEYAKKHIKNSYKEGLTSISAVLLTKKGNIYTGVNLKYKKIYKCICAERVAIAKAIEKKERDFDTIVSVKYEPEDNQYFVVNMCGECRQIAFCHRPLKIIVDEEGILNTVSIEKIFPFPYR